MLKENVTKSPLRLGVKVLTAVTHSCSGTDDRKALELSSVNPALLQKDFKSLASMVASRSFYYLLKSNSHLHKNWSVPELPVLLSHPVYPPTASSSRLP